MVPTEGSYHKESSAQLLARLKYQRGGQNYRMTDKTNTICSPTFDLGGKKICMSVVYCLQKLYSCYYLTNILTFLMRRGAILQEFYNLLHSSDMSIVQKFLTNQIVANEIIIVMTPYCPTHQHLLICRKE